MTKRPQWTHINGVYTCWCIVCDKELSGIRGFCSTECYNKYWKIKEEVPKHRIGWRKIKKELGGEDD